MPHRLFPTPHRFIFDLRWRVYRQAVHGQFQHILERRADSLLDAAIEVWSPYVEDILQAFDTLPADAEIDRTLMVINFAHWSWCCLLLVSTSRLPIPGGS